jgi:transposase
MQTCTLAVMGPSGKRLTSRVVETNGRALVEAIRSIPGRRHVCLEEGTQSAWLCELLRPHVEDVVVTLSAKRKGAKDDLRDAWALVEERRIGSLKTVVYKASPEMSGLRDAVRGYTMLTGDLVRVKNRLRALYRSRGLRTDERIYRSEERGAWERKLPVSHGRLAEMFGGYLDTVEEMRETAEDWLREEAKRHAAVKLLGTAPGLGKIRSAQVVAIVGTPERFRTTRQFWSYCGLGIVTRSSSDWVRQDGRWLRAQIVQTRGLNRNRHPLLKAVFKGAATTVVQGMPEHPLHRDYQRLLESGVKPNLAKLTVARRIAAAVLDVEAPGGLRPEEAVPERDDVGEGDGGGCPRTPSRRAPARARFEGEHPDGPWSLRRERETPPRGYAPSEYRTKRWPAEALLGGWYPHPTTGESCFTFGLRTRGTRTELPLTTGRNRARVSGPVAPDSRRLVLHSAHLDGVW